MFRLRPEHLRSADRIVIWHGLFASSKNQQLAGHFRDNFKRGGPSGEARTYVDHIDPKLVLIDGRRLAELMIDFDVGVHTTPTCNVKRVDSDYFDDSGAVYADEPAAAAAVADAPPAAVPLLRSARVIHVPLWSRVAA